MNDIYERLNNVFRNVFDDDSIVVNENTTASDIEEWDSLEHINLIVAIENEFNVKFTMGETTSLKNVGEIVELIAKKMEA